MLKILDQFKNQGRKFLENIGILKDRRSDIDFFRIWSVEQRWLRLSHKREQSVRELTKARNSTLDAQNHEEPIGNRAFDEEKRLKTLGLALSGGGIRAASFSLGVMQGLNLQDKRLLQHVDYLSTVSGGGYAGAALTYYRKIAKEARQEQESGSPGPVTRKLDGTDVSSFPEPEHDVLMRNESKMLDFIRFRRNHLTPTTWINFASMLAVALRTIVISWPIYLAMLTLFLMIPIYLSAEALFGPVAGEDCTHCLSIFGRSLADFYSVWLFSGLGDIMQDSEQVTLGVALLTISVGIFAVWLLIAIFVSPMAVSFENWHYRLRRIAQIISGVVVIMAAVAIILIFVPVVAPSLAMDDNWGKLAGFLFAGQAIGGISLISLKEGTLIKHFASVKVGLLIAALFLLIGNVILSYELAEFILGRLEIARTGENISVDFDKLEFEAWIAIGFVSGFTLLGWFSNLNYVSLHRMYRDRLMEAFMPDIRAFLKKKNNKPAREADRVMLKDCLQRPLHLVNTNIVLSNSGQSRYRGRSGDSFILAPHFCGSWVTGYRRTTTFSARPNSRDEGMTLATAMAISGAAFNPRVGPSGWATPLSNPIIASMASFLNLRLGCWVANPGKYNQSKKANFFNAGRWGLFNWNFKETAPLVELTDGGHFENTGIFELLRRRVDVIIFADSSADRSFNFKDIGIAIERARVDQSVDIRFSIDDFDLTHLMPGSAGDEHYHDRYKMAERGYAIGKIHYPAFEYEDKATGKRIPVAAKEGCFIYLKTVITRKMPTDILSYKGAHDEFPYQPIVDQMFDESQFESYRALGYDIASKMNEHMYKSITDFLGSNRAIKTSSP